MDILAAFAAAINGDEIPCAVTINEDGPHVLVAQGTLQFSPQHYLQQGRHPVLVMAQFSGSPTSYEHGPDFEGGFTPISPPKFTLSVSNNIAVGISVTFTHVNGNRSFTFIPQNVKGVLFGIGDGFFVPNTQAMYTITFGTVSRPP